MFNSRDRALLAEVELKSNAIEGKPLNGQQFDFYARIRTNTHVPDNNLYVKSKLLVDTGASGRAFVDRRFVKLHKLPTMALHNPIKLRLADDNYAPNISHAAQVMVNLHGHVESLWCLITELGQFAVILGMPWVQEHDIRIEGGKRSIEFHSDHCMEHCLVHHEPIKIFSGLRKQPERPPSKPPDHDIREITAVAFMKLAAKADHETVVMLPEHFAMLDQPKENDRYLAYLAGSNFTTDVAAITPEDYEKFYDKIKKDPPTLKELEEEIHPLFRHWVKMFNPQEANKLPPNRSIDHAIDLVPGAIPPAKKAYGVSRQEGEVIKAYIEDMKGKKYIRNSTSQYAAPTLIVKKPDGGLRVCVDYRGLNALTIKNRNTPPLIKETLQRLCKARFYSKFDIIAAFNEIRMRPGDEHKTAFITRYGLFEYVVMPFGLCNAPATFQSFINETLSPYLDDFCTAYMDDILVYSNTEEEHEEHVNKVLAKLDKAGLYLDIKKCAFFVKQVKYLGLIITTEGIQMDPEKIKCILEWKAPECLRDVQAFLGFANFYRRFILNYSGLARPLSALTNQANKGLGFPWRPSGPEDLAFQALKKAFTEAPILHHFDPDLETWIESDVSDFVVAAVLSQMGPDGLLHPVAFMSKTMSPAECNYEIYDKELLAIVRAFEEWHPECAGTPVEEPIKVITDHRNLEHFMTTKQLNRRQARWAEFLSEFNFKIIYRPGVLGAKPDSLTRRSQDLPSSVDDPRNQFQKQTILKQHNLGPGIAKAVALAPLLLSTTYNPVAELACLLRDSIEPQLIVNQKLAIACKEFTLAANRVIEPPLPTAPDPAFPPDTPRLPTPSMPMPSEPVPPTIQPSPAEAATPSQEEEPVVSELDPEVLARQISEAYPHDQEVKQIIAAKEAGERKIPPHLRKSIKLELGDCTVVTDPTSEAKHLLVRGKMYVPRTKDNALRADAIRSQHEPPTAGHPGRTGTLQKVQSHYYWPTLYPDVKEYVRSCPVCKHSKSHREHKHGLLKPLPIPDRYWQDISCDFITSLPPCRYGGRLFQHILVVVDRLSKGKKFIPMDSLEVKAVVQAFIDFVWRSEGFPATIISDRGTQFVAHFWQRLCKRLGTKPKLSTAFHPETDGQTENANAALKQYLRAYVHYNQDDWVSHLATAEFVANSHISESTGLSPFFATKGYLPRSGLEPPDAFPSDSTPEARRDLKDADKTAAKIEALREFLRQELVWAQAKQVEFANRGRAVAPEFRVGDKVMLDIRNVATTRPSKSLEHKNAGPYEIVRAIDNHAYELKLPESMNLIHPVFHPWLLHLDKSKPLPGQRIRPPPPVTATDGSLNYPVVGIGRSRINKRKIDSNADPSLTTPAHMLQYQILFAGYTDYNNRPKWEDYDMADGCPHFVADFHHRYPDAAGPHWTFETPPDWEPIE